MTPSRRCVYPFAALAVAAAIACGTTPTQVVADHPKISGDSSVVAAATVAGQWSRLDGLTPYRFAESWNLSTTGAAISGSGTWSGEACCAGTLSITGSFDADSVHVVVNLVTTSGAAVPPRKYRFDGVLVPPNKMAGVAVASDSSRTEEQLQKQH